jgi:diphthine-ammonia ligase
MKLASLFSGGKDSVYSAYLAKKQGHDLVCLITIHSKNKESYMFHTPSIKKTTFQADSIGLPLIVHKTEGKKEEELKDLEDAIKKAIKKYKIEGIVTGAIRSVYQASRIQKICDNLKIKCINPLWEKDEINYLNELLKENFKVMIIGVFAYPLNQKWLGRIIDENFIKEVKILNEKYKIHPAGEGGEFETFVLDCPLFKKALEIKKYEDFKEGENSFRREIEIK